jgi:hypothetical protein
MDSMGTKLFTIGLSIAAMMFIVIFFIAKSDPISRESILKIIGADREQDFLDAKEHKEIEDLIRNLPKKARKKLKAHFLSQDLQMAVKMIRKHIRGEDIGE